MKSLFGKIAIFLFHLLFLVVPLTFTTVNDELFEFNKMLVVYGFTLLLLACWTADSIIKQRVIFRRTPLDIPILIFLISQIISTVFSINQHTSVFGYYTRFNGGLLSTLCYIALYYLFIIFIEAKYLKSIITSILVGGVLSALYAFPEHFGHSPSCFILGKFDPSKFNVECWVQDVKTRVFGTFGQPNWLAAYLGMLLPLAIVGVKQVDNQVKLMKEAGENSFFKTIFRLCIAALFISVLYFTGSRSGIIAVVTGLGVLGVSVVFFLTKLSDKTHKEARDTVIKYGLTLVATGAIVLVTTFLIANPIRDKFLSLLRKPVATSSAQSAPTVVGTQLEVGGSESGQIRNVVWKGALLVWRRYPIFGSGVETFAYSYYKDRPTEHNLLSEWDFLYNKAHNEFLNYLATTGIVGLISYCILLALMIGYPIKSAYYLVMLKEKRWKNQPEKIIRDAFILMSLSSGLIILAISNFFGFSTVMVALLLFIFPALSVVITNGYKLDQEETSSSNQEVTSSQWLLIVSIVSVLIIPLFYIKKMWLADTLFAKGKQMNSFGQFEAAFPHLRKATELLPEEPTFHDEFSYNLASLAVTFARNEDATKTADFASMAISESNTVVEQNSVHTNFWKTRTKVFLTLAQLQTSFYSKAEEALLSARELSPTDPKILLYLALLAQAKNEDQQYLELLLKSIELKPNFEEARTNLAKFYEERKQTDKAIEQYQYMIKFINPNNQMAKDKIASLSAIKK